MKVWNISDHPETDVEAQNLFLYGRSVAPGRFVRVPDEALKNPRKLMKEVAAGLAHLGETPPEDYLKARKPPKAEKPLNGVFAHGALLETKAEEPQEEKPEEAPKEEPKVEEKTTEEVPEILEASEEKPEEKVEEKPKRRGRGKKKEEEKEE